MQSFSPLILLLIVVQYNNVFYFSTHLLMDVSGVSSFPLFINDIGMFNPVQIPLCMRVSLEWNKGQIGFPDQEETSRILCRYLNNDLKMLS